MQELAERQERMFNWDDKARRDEDKIMEQMRLQKEEMIAKKLADQQKEILRDMNKEDVDRLLANHRRQIAALEKVLKQEQDRQLANMRAKQREKNSDLNKDKIAKQIKLAEIQKKKVADAARAREIAQTNEQDDQEALVVKNEKLDQCKEKVGIMSKLIFKAAYSRHMQYKRHLVNQHKLNEFLGRNLLDEKDGDASDEFSLSNASFINRNVAENRQITYAELLERISAAEKNYDMARTSHLAGRTQDLQSSYG